ncbi:S24 family peptidase [Stenotrophomonas maltophilia]|uniref:S24 family peptidase n=1 Tax=Stenotrophomonas maltophilia TaxID=40324 RepID=UPI00255316DC|nr:S24 family peptidase [Stenotrophomonas maltophilia]
MNAFISFAVMPSAKPHNRTITPADTAAAARLKAIWKALPRDKRPTQQQMADEWEGPGEANQSLISQYMNGIIALNYRAVLSFAKQLGCKDTDIRDDLPEQAAASALTPNFDDYEPVIGYSQAVGLGEGAEAVEYAATHSLMFKATSLRRRGIYGRNLAIYYGKGDSMEPTIKDGDAILFDTSDTRVMDDTLYVIQVDGMAHPEYYVKRAMVLDTGIYFQSDNPRGDHKWQKPKPMASKRNPITVIGRVHWIGGWAD